jgi:thiol:disulfide interchange protein DsbD
VPDEAFHEPRVSSSSSFSSSSSVLVRFMVPMHAPWRKEAFHEPYQPEGLADSSRRSQRSGDLRCPAKNTSTPKVVPEGGSRSQCPGKTGSRVVRLQCKMLSGCVVVLLAFATVSLSMAQSPFTVTPSICSSNGSCLLTLHFGLPPNHHLYAERLSFRWTGESSLIPPSLPKPEPVVDKFSGETNLGFEHPFDASLVLAGSADKNRSFEVRFQGCDESQCYFPEVHTFAFSASGQVAEVTAPEETTTVAAASPASSWRQLADNFQVAARGSGYMGSKDFLAFLNSAKGESAVKTRDALSFFQRWGWLATVGLILLGGIGLNLTPCILPLIPINLAIIGAGGKNSNRRRGFALGATYGLGMAAAYGGLGLLVVLTGSKFGTLNSSPWFNLAIAVIFVVLALSMFDKLSIDLSRFQTHFRPTAANKSRGPFVLALTMGAVAALLAGACVAPVVISALLLSANLYSHGAWLGLALPFCLGLGMALPWPIAGAGLALLPKPGAWMTKVKYGFGVFIALFALYYGHIGYSLFQTVRVAARENSSSPGAAPGSEASKALLAALQQSQQDGKPVFIDFWASWCKNCSAMEHTTFDDHTVRQQLAFLHEVRFQAERPNEQPAREVLDYFGAIGLPTYILLTPARAAEAARALAPLATH